LIIRGPDELVKEVEAFVKKLDDPALQSRGPRVSVIRLEGTNGERMEEALQSMMRRGRSGR